MSEAKLQKAIFLDRDGVINKLLNNVPDEKHNPLNYVLSWDDFEFLPGVFEAFNLIKESDYIPIIISNQSGIGRGYVDREEIGVIFSKTEHEIWKAVGLDVYSYFCSHASEDGCACRKPSPGMLYQAAIEHHIDLLQSWMIGDSDKDIHAGHNAEIKGLVKIVHDCREKSKDMRYYFVGMVGDSDEESNRSIVHIMPNLLEAVEHIIATREP